MFEPHPQIIIGSTRPGRRGAAVGTWFYDLAVRHDKFGVELIDLAEVNLPLLDEPLQPGRALHPGTHPASKQDRQSRSGVRVRGAGVQPQL
jgi:NAD(P)H-dependent FMN reductase